MGRGIRYPRMKRWIKATVAAGLLTLIIAAPGSAGVVGGTATGGGGTNWSGWCRSC